MLMLPVLCSISVASDEDLRVIYELRAIAQTINEMCVPEPPCTLRTNPCTLRTNPWGGPCDGRKQQVGGPSAYLATASLAWMGAALVCSVVESQSYACFSRSGPISEEN